MKGKDRISVLLRKGNNVYLFMQAGIVSDGSLEIWFPDIKDNLGISQTIEIQQGKSGATTSLIETHDSGALKEETCYISYHTSGLVRYHKMSFDNAYMEPLCEIKESNPFFMYSFVDLEKAFKCKNQKQHTSPVALDISDLGDKRIDILLSILPLGEEPKHSGMILFRYPLYCLCLELLDDNKSFCLSQCF